MKPDDPASAGFGVEAGSPPSRVGSSAPAAGALPWVGGRFAEVGAILSGALYCLAFAGFDVWPLTFVCFVPLYLVLIGQPTRRAAWLGFLSGLTMNLGGFYWLVDMLETFSGFPIPVCVLFTVVVCAYQGGRLAWMGWLYGRATAGRWPVAPVFVAAFAASELTYPLLFPWYYAATVHDVPVLMQLADLGGPILVGVALVVINVAVAEPIRARLSGARDLDGRIVGAGALALSGMLLYGEVRVTMTHARVAAAEPVRVGYVQGNMDRLAKRKNPGEGLRRHRALTAELRDQGAELVVWSETSVSTPTREDRAANGQVFGDPRAASLGVPTLFGATLYRVEAGQKRMFNAAIATDADGRVRGRYDKHHLLAFGEYLPFGDTFPILYDWSPHSGRFSSGTSLEPLLVDIGDGTHEVTVLICYEDILPGFTNRAVSHGDPELLVNMTNDAWFGDTHEPWQHLALAKFRAIEHRRFLVRGTNTGVSAIIDPTGAVVDGTLSTPFETEARHGLARWMRGTTVYERVGDGPWFLVTFGSWIACFRRRAVA